MFLLLQILTLFILLLWKGYWFITKVQSQKEKPQTAIHFSFVSYHAISRFVTYFLGGLLGLQLLGLQLFSFPRLEMISLIGFASVLIGVGISIVARKQLRNNWSPCYEYQVKKKQQLVTTGIYGYIRNPIYTGITLFFIGSELVVSSYLWIVVGILVLGGAYLQSKKEEKILEKHFGQDYREYKNRTKMLIPFVW